MFAGAYRGKKVLVTGHTGFKGAWLSLWLKELGAEVCGLGLAAPTHPNLYEIVKGHAFQQEVMCDIRDRSRLETVMGDLSPDFVFHLAAQSLVRPSYLDPLGTLQTNVMGTANLLETIVRLKWPGTVVVVSSDKCYRNVNSVHGYREDDPLGGRDFYSMSKAATELVVQAWHETHFAVDARLGNLVSARAGNVIGGGDYAEHRIVPDCVRALIEGQPIVVRNPASTRPWQHVLDCLSGYLWLGARVHGVAKDSPLVGPFNFGPATQPDLTVQQLVETILDLWPGTWERTGDTKQPHEAQKLNLAIDKAAALLKWLPTWDFAEAIRQTIAWYHRRHVGASSNMLAYSLEQLDSFTKAARTKEIAWAADKRP
jgi:CDP-glucose 4,6-dehydratase